MSTILITGMTSSQASAVGSRKAASFASLIRTQLSSDHTIDWLEPDVLWTADFFAKYDAILVGVAPITSLAANRAYGALNVITHLLDDPRLTFFIDAPNPELIRHSLRATVKAPHSLIKPFYAARKGYAVASTKQGFTRLLGTVKRLLVEDWPTTLYPSLPWESPLLLPSLQKSVTPDMVGLNLDHAVVKAAPPLSEKAHPFGAGWMIDNPRGRWATAVTVNLVRPVAQIRPTNAWTDEKIVDGMRNAVGVIVSPQRKGGTWWSYRYAQALSVGAPVISEWRETQALKGWNYLASEIEAMTPGEQRAVAETQREAYAQAVAWTQDRTNQLEYALKLKGSNEED